MKTGRIRGFPAGRGLRMPLRWFYESIPVTGDIQPIYVIENGSIIHNIKYYIASSTAIAGSCTFTISLKSGSVTRTICTFTISSTSTKQDFVFVLKEAPVKMYPGDVLSISQTSTLITGCTGLNIHLDVEQDI